MAAVRASAVLVLLSVLPVAERVSGQRAPCYQCELNKDGRPHSNPYQQVRSHCTYPCECDEREPSCEIGTPVVRDGCGCCPICAAQLGQPCDGTAICDEKKGLVCHYPYLGAVVGICQATTGFPCMVSNKTYNHGETFQMDCRTQCSCQNGTYACSSLCPNENISPTGACKHPRLVDVPDQCCREWMCDSTEAEHPPVCKAEFTSWSTCSAACGLGISHRISNLNQECTLQNETRICQLRPCELGMLSMDQHARHHHIRKGHECKATQRVSGPVRLRFGPCRSRKRYRPKFCGSCAEKVDDGCCTPQLSTTIKVEFICDSVKGEESADDILLDLIEPGRDLWWPDDLLAIDHTTTTTSDPPREATFLDYQETTKPLHAVNDNFDSFRQSIGWETEKNANHLEKVPYYDFKKTPTVKKEAGKISLEDMHLLDNRHQDQEYEPLLHADVLVYDPNYDETKLYRKPDSRSVARVTPSIQETSGEKAFQSVMTTSASVTEAVSTEATTTKPKKKKKKKPRKAFTSWLEFRDEEYQMDEEEDEDDESNQSRKKRSVEKHEKESSKIIRRTHRDGDPSRPKHHNIVERSTGSGSFREGHLEDSHGEDYDDENEEEEEEQAEEDEDEEEDDGRKEEPEKPLYYAFFRRKRDLVPSQLDSKNLANLSPEFMNMQELIKKKKLKKGESKYKNQIERKSNLLRKIMTEEQQGRKSKSTRVFSQSQWREIGKHNQEMRRRKLKRKNHTGLGRKEQNKGPQQRSQEWTGEGKKPLSKLERIKEVAARPRGNDTARRHKEGKARVIHTAGKVHKARTRRHAPRPAWTDPQDNAWGDHTVSFSVEWIVKCRCNRDCGAASATTPSSELSNDGEVILRRVHRTAPP